MPPKVLLVDDDRLIHQLYHSHLEKAGYEMVSAFKGNEAVELADRELPQAIVMDIMMPEMDGLSAMREIKRNVRTKDIPVIALGDQPHLANATLRAVSEFAAQQLDKICQPSRNGRPRHPVFLPRRIFETLAHATHCTLKEFLSPHASEVRLTEVNDPGLDFDLDTPADFAEARTRFSTP